MVVGDVLDCVKNDKIRARDSHLGRAHIFEFLLERLDCTIADTNGFLSSLVRNVFFIMKTRFFFVAVDYDKRRPIIHQ